MTIDLATLAAAIKRTEEEIALFPESEFPEEHKQARALVAAGKAWLERHAGDASVHDQALIRRESRNLICQRLVTDGPKG